MACARGGRGSAAYASPANPASHRNPEPRAPDSEEFSRLTSEDEPRLPPEDPEVFFDAHDQDAHGKFLRWRERTQRMYVISRRSASDAMLHQADCGHFEHGDKSASLTRTMKVCSRCKRGRGVDPREYRRHAHEVQKLHVVLKSAQFVLESWFDTRAPLAHNETTIVSGGGMLNL